VAGFLGSPSMNFLPVRMEAGAAPAQSVMFVGTNVKLPWPRSGTPPGDYTLGIRPEHVRLDAGEGSGNLIGRVQLVELLGDVFIVTVELPSPTAERPPSTIVCKTTAAFTAPAGGRVVVSLNLDEAHLFDTATGENRLNSAH
jgi:ABC-type sugar transport system ATPase subunit